MHSKGQDNGALAVRACFTRSTLMGVRTGSCKLSKLQQGARDAAGLMLEFLEGLVVRFHILQLSFGHPRDSKLRYSCSKP